MLCRWVDDFRSLSTSKLLKMLAPFLFVLGAVPLTLGLSSLKASTPNGQEEDECAVISRRISWRNLTSTEKSDYIKADLCLMSSPPKAGINGAKNRWDELQYIHIAQTDYVHGVGAFLPFHRYFMKVHEHVLRTECNYTGPLPYWDEPADIGNIIGSPLFDVETGFGGNGTGAGNCVADGPFANLTLRFQADLSIDEYCLSRYLNDRALSMATEENVEKCLERETYVEAWNCLEGLPHGAGHGAVMGTMINPFTSPGDPIFYLHHGYLDKLWWDWQSRNLTTRLTEIGGNNTARGPGFGPGFGGGAPGGGPGGGFPGGNPFGGNGSFPFPGFPPSNGSSPFPFPGGNKTVNKAFTDYFNDGGNVTTLNHTLWSAGVMDNITIADVMDPSGKFMCTEYL
ncbi:Di-copper centre-containing protein [Annulohypoxylon moriforme]|nr:Di-copper centre-containing protein [Annulohypoxylon moriforme]